MVRFKLSDAAAAMLSLDDVGQCVARGIKWDGKGYVTMEVDQAMKLADEFEWASRNFTSDAPGSQVRCGDAAARRIRDAVQRCRNGA